ncbi:hypothetical protein BVRB_8g200970 [Beta vulgaris subsp. vulgaris]|uniref:Gnk2-homologous domain-containing protein n=1 Tax=Beta vulgaris subsp. vulgaris TaxID=3555 RepID=A0A0J8B5X1_BETVV|nr:hypothetical protein BVRB_8g200970 [Beta vulgaris subsp. vulgaris]
MQLFLLDTSIATSPILNYNISRCYNSSLSSTYPLGSSYETNLNHLFSTLDSQISTAKHGFTTHKQESQNHDSAFGLAMCQGDLDSVDCRDCVQMASRQLPLLCPRAIQAILWKEQCMLRYSNESFFSVFQENPHEEVYNINNITTNISSWFKCLNDTLNEVILMAASNNSGYMYATKEAWYSPMNRNLFTLVQCTPDLSKENCTKCFSVAKSRIYNMSSRGGAVLMPSCTLRYEIYPFYDTSTLQDLAPPPNIAIFAYRGKKQKSATILVVAIIVPLAILGMLILSGIYLLKKKARKYPSRDFQNVFHDLATAESLMFELGVLEAATNNFSDDLKLGQGGFGSVYKPLNALDPSIILVCNHLLCQGSVSFRQQQQRALQTQCVLMLRKSRYNQ